MTAVLDSGEILARVGIGPHSLRIELAEDRALEFDAAGRLILAQIEGRGLRRTMDNRLLVTRHLRQGARRGWSREPSPAHPVALLAGWHAEAAALLQRLREGATARTLRGQLPDPRSWTERALEPASRWNEAALLADTQRLQSIYRPIPILPPDQYASIVLQATEGCSFNRCGFCNFYREIPYRERSVDEFHRHLDAVLAHLGATARRYHRVFLGQANALLIDTDRLLAMLAATTHRLPLLPAGLATEARRRWRGEHELWIEGIYSFVDSFHRTPSVEDLGRLAEAGLRRVYLGLETGSRKVLHVLGKPGHPEAAVELASALHAAGVHLGVIVLVGAGGRPHARAHVEETTAVLGRMALRKGDQVYLSHLVIHDGSEYAKTVAAQGLTPLDRGEQAEQQGQLRRGLRAVVGPGVPVSPYDVALSRRVFGGIGP